MRGTETPQFGEARPGGAIASGATDHEPVWLAAAEAERTLVHDFYRWAVRGR